MSLSLIVSWKDSTVSVFYFHYISWDLLPYQDCCSQKYYFLYLSYKVDHFVSRMWGRENPYYPLNLHYVSPHWRWVLSNPTALSFIIQTICINSAKSLISLAWTVEPTTLSSICKMALKSPIINQGLVIEFDLPSKSCHNSFLSWTVCNPYTDKIETFVCVIDVHQTIDILFIYKNTKSHTVGIHSNRTLPFQFDIYTLLPIQELFCYYLFSIFSQYSLFQYLYHVNFIHL